MRLNAVMICLLWMGWPAGSSALGAVADDGLGHCNGARAWLQRQQSAQKGRETMPLDVPTQPALRAQLLAMEQREQ